VKKTQRTSTTSGPVPNKRSREGGRGTQTHPKEGRIGSPFDDPLKEEGTYESARAVSIKRVLASQIGQAMEEKRITKVEMARRMDTSRSQLDRLLDPDSHSVTLETLARAVGRQVRAELV
jgi:antitoxin HicB